MENVKKAIETIIGAAIKGEKAKLPENLDMELLYKQLKRHSITAIGYHGLVLCGADKTHPVMQQLMQQYIITMLGSERQMAAVEHLFEIFEENNIDYLPLKGCNMKRIYPKHELRIMGDADILIREEKYPLVKNLLEKEGYEFKMQASHTKNWQNKDLHLEIHTHVIPDSDEDYFHYYKDSWFRAVHQCNHRYSYSKEDEFIYLFTHFARHFRTGGIGYRQFTDLWVYTRFFAELDHSYIAAEMEKLKMQKFYENIMDAVKACFEDGPKDSRTEFITDFIFNSGNWGSIKSHTISMGLKNNTKGVKGKGNTKIAMFINAAFPEVKLIRIRYPVLHKYPWLLPLFWCVRWFDAALNRRQNFKNKINEVRDVNEAEVLHRKQLFDSIGLEYN